MAKNRWYSRFMNAKDPTEFFSKEASARAAEAVLKAPKVGVTPGTLASAAGDDASSAAGRYYPATSMWRLPGAVQGRRRRAAVLQGARLQRVRERGRGDRHVPVLRRGPVAGGLFQRCAIAVAGGLLERRGDRARAVEELGVIRKQYLETIVN